MTNITRKQFIATILRGGVFAGLVALCAILFSRESKAACNMRCQGCLQFRGGVCGLGVK